MLARFVRWLLCLIGVVLFGAAGFWFVTLPSPMPEEHWANLGDPDLKNGEMVFWAGGCVSCHAAPGSEGDARMTLAGGLALKSPFGTFHVPNISPDETKQPSYESCQHSAVVPVERPIVKCRDTVPDARLTGRAAYHCSNAFPTSSLKT